MRCDIRSKEGMWFICNGTCFRQTGTSHQSSDRSGQGDIGKKTQSINQSMSTTLTHARVIKLHTRVDIESHHRNHFSHTELRTNGLDQLSYFTQHNIEISVDYCRIQQN